MYYMLHTISIFVNNLGEIIFISNLKMVVT